MKPKSWWEENIGIGNHCDRVDIARELESNQCVFGLLTPTEQEVMRECEVDYYDQNGKWYDISSPSFDRHITYRVRADFVPEYGLGEAEPPALEWGEWIDCDIIYGVGGKAEKIRFRKEVKP